MTIKAVFRTFLQPRALVCAALVFSPLTATAASISLDTFAGTHFHEGGNLGAGYAATNDANRTAYVPITPGGFAFLSTRDHYAGEIPSVASTRLGAGEAAATTIGLVESDGFFFAGSVDSTATCTFKDKLTGCIPFMGSQSRVRMEFTADMDSTLFLDGTWQGGNGTESPVSVVDFFSLSIREVQSSGAALNIFSVDTNTFNRNEAGGIFDGQLNLTSGTTYIFDFNQRAHSQSPDVSGASDSDGGSFAFSASLNQNNDVAFYTARANALVPTPVPLPAGALLLLTGLGALALSRRAQPNTSS